MIRRVISIPELALPGDFGYNAGGGSPLVPIDPSELSPIAWGDPSDISTLWQDDGRTTPVVADGDPIRYWDDLSGNANDFFQSTLANSFTYRTSIINGLSIARADGITDWMEGANGLDLSAGYTMFAVLIWRNFAGGSQTPMANFRNVGSLRRWAFRSLATGVVQNRGSSGGAGDAGRATDTNAIADDTTYLMDFGYDGGILPGGFDIFRNGTQIDTSDISAGTFTGIPVATTRVTLAVISPATTEIWPGDLGEFIIFDRLLTTNERAGLRLYFYNKWGIV